MMGIYIFFISSVIYIKHKSDISDLITIDFDRCECDCGWYISHKNNYHRFDSTLYLENTQEKIDIKMYYQCRMFGQKCKIATICD